MNDYEILRNSNLRDIFEIRNKILVSIVLFVIRVLLAINSLQPFYKYFYIALGVLFLAGFYKEIYRSHKLLIFLYRNFKVNSFFKLSVITALCEKEFARENVLNPKKYTETGFILYLLCCLSLCPYTIVLFIPHLVHGLFLAVGFSVIILLLTFQQLDKLADYISSQFEFKNQNKSTNTNQSDVGINENEYADAMVVFEISELPSKEELKKKYRLLCKMNHPDVHLSKDKLKLEECERKMKIINPAYATLLRVYV